MKIWFAKKLHKVAYLWWSNWSKVYRLIYHSKYRKVVLEKNMSLGEVEDGLKRLRWSPDSWKELWDACGSPKRVQHELDEMASGKPWPHIQMDCDDFAIWAANVIKSTFYPRVFTFSWIAKDGSMKGHAMCLLRQKDGRIFHVGNWKTSSPYNNLREACEHILLQRSAKEAICWGIFDKDLKLLSSGSGLPSEKLADLHF